MRKTPRERESASESWENGTNLRYVKYVTSFIVLSELKTIFACTGSVKRDGEREFAREWKTRISILNLWS